MPFGEMTEELRKTLRKLTDEMYNKIKRCRNIEKSSWRYLDSLETYIDTIFTRIDKESDESVSNLFYPGSYMKLRQMQSYPSMIVVHKTQFWFWFKKFTIFFLFIDFIFGIYQSSKAGIKFLENGVVDQSSKKYYIPPKTEEEDVHPTGHPTDLTVMNRN